MVGQLPHLCNLGAFGYCGKTQRPMSMTPPEFADRITAWGRTTMIGSHGTRFLTAGEGRAVAQRVPKRG